MHNKHTPPRRAEWLLARFISGQERSLVLGDLAEEYAYHCETMGVSAATRWYRRQVVTSIPVFFLRALYWGTIMWAHYLMVALRNMIRQPGYAGINILGLTIGITCSMLIFLYIRHELSYDRFHENADRIYRVVDGNSSRTPYELAAVLKKNFPEISHYTRMAGTQNIYLVSYKDKTFIEQNVYGVDRGFFEIFSFPFVKGQPGGLVISEAVAEKLFGDEDPINKVIGLDGTISGRVSGVMKTIPSNSHLKVDILQGVAINMSGHPMWNPKRFFTYILLVEGTDPAALEDKIIRWAETYEPFEAFKAQGWSIEPRLQAVTDIHLRSQLKREFAGTSDIRYIYIFSTVAGFILLIACINFMNLTTVRAIVRAKEVGIRKTIGALRGQLIRQYLGESMLSAGLAFVISLGLLIIILPWFNALVGKELQVNYSENPEILIWLVGITLLVGLLSGSYPALFISGLHPVRILNGTLAGGATRGLLIKSLAVVQFTISILLIISTAVVYQQLEFMRNKRLGFDKEQVIIIPLIRAEGSFIKLRERLSQNPYILGVTRTSAMPGRMAGGAYLQDVSIHLKDRPEGEAIKAANLLVGFDFEKTMGINIIAGRSYIQNHEGFSSWQRLDEIVLNETAVKRLGFASPEEAIGQLIDHPEVFQLYSGLTLGYQAGVPSMTIIGVVEDFHMESLQQPIEPMMLTLWDRTFGQMAVRLDGRNISQSLDAIKAVWPSVYSDYTLTYSFLDDDFERLHLSDQRIGNLFGVFSFLAISISCLGLFGLVAFTIQQRTREIGIHKVLGASVSQVVVLLSRDFLKLVVIAVPFAWTLAYWAMNIWLQNFAYRIDMGFWWFLIAGVLALVIALVTIGAKAARAALVNPVETLRYE